MENFPLITLIICIGVIVYAIYKLANINNYGSLNSQDLAAVQQIDPSILRSEASMENLRKALVADLNCKLTCPSTAKLCGDSSLLISGPNKDGKFSVLGFVDAQNSYGAYKRSNFNATARFWPDTQIWFVEKLVLW